MVTVAQGVLGWGRSERISDRYGAVFFASEPTPPIKSEDSLPAEVFDSLSNVVGSEGTLSATVLTPRESGHIGDIIRGFVQDRVPETGETLVLGEGTLFVDSQPDPMYTAHIGVEPIDDETTDWLDPEILYTLHNCTVELSFIPE